jgi:serine/threonine protein kinase
MMVNFPRLLVGQTIFGRYRVTLALPPGVHGYSYSAWDIVADAPVVLKQIWLLHEPGPALTSYWNGQIEVSGIEPVHAHVREGSTHYLVRRFFHEGGLEPMFANDRPLSLEHAVALIITIARSIAAAEAIGLYHGGLKPSNVMINANGDVHIVDFGEEGLTWPIRTVLEPDKVFTRAPEQLDGTVGPAADVYALGAMLYRLLTGSYHLPLVGCRDEDERLLHLSARSLYWPECIRLPDWLHTHLEKALAYDPAARYTTVADFLRALESDFHVGEGAVPPVLIGSSSSFRPLDGANEHAYHDFSFPSPSPGEELGTTGRWGGSLSQSVAGALSLVAGVIAGIVVTVLLLLLVLFVWKRVLAAPPATPTPTLHRALTTVKPSLPWTNAYHRRHHFDYGGWRRSSHAAFKQTFLAWRLDYIPTRSPTIRATAPSIAVPLPQPSPTVSVKPASP